MTTRKNRNLYVLVIGLLILVGCARIISTYSIFSQTWDEPSHIAAGMEWLDEGTFTFEPTHPPLARLMTALGPYLAGIRSIDTPGSWWSEGNAILQYGGQYERNLALARLGILPFFILASIVVAKWSRELFGYAASILATTLFTTLPIILAHAGNATTDMACAATVTLSMYWFSSWVKKPNLRNSIIFGLTIGIAAITKFSTIFFLIGGIGLFCIIALLAKIKSKKLIKEMIIKRKIYSLALISIFLTGGLTIWAGYRFSIDKLGHPENRPYEPVDRIVGNQGVLHNIAYTLVENILVPAPEFFTGLLSFLGKDSGGQLEYFLGDIRTTGWWYFYPVIFLLKTPIAFTILCLAGIIFIFSHIFNKRGNWDEISIPLISVGAIFTVGMIGNVDNGLRQLLSVFPLLAIIAGFGLYRLFTSVNKRRYLVWSFAAGLFAWQFISSAGAHPDYLAYFNEIGRNYPEKIVVSSDLDWGQDLKRLSQTLKQDEIDHLYIRYNGSQEIDLNNFGLPANKILQPYQKVSGWVAISIFSRTLGTWKAPYDQFAWLKEYQPVRIVGKSIWLYYIPEK
jgi:hypothetical protein